MSAASLANDFPTMRAIGIQTQQQAIASLNTPQKGLGLLSDTEAPNRKHRATQWWIQS
jgi:hypothetical protein